MYRPTDRQMPLFGSEASLSESARSRLRGSWAEWFRQEVMPELLASEARFSGLYGENGRPNWSVARLLAVSFLQQLEDLDDQRALDALSFDLRWHHALALTAEDAYLSRRSLVEFRRRLVIGDPEGALTREVFDRVCAAGLKNLKLSAAHQRLDSTLISSDIRSRGRLSLARETLRVFLRGLGDSKRALVSEAIGSWYDGEDGWEHETSGKEAKDRLAEVGTWARELVEQFADDEDVRDSQPYQLLVRLITEHASALGQTQSDNDDEQDDDDDEPVAASQRATTESGRRKRKKRKKRKKHKKQGKARYWSPHDPDASFGHKGLGYHVHITETCRNNSTELLTDYEVVTAAENDVGKAMPVIERLHERGIGARKLYADGGYPTAEHLIAARATGTELVAPVHRGSLPTDCFSRDDFARDDADRIIACPAGHAPTRQGERVSVTKSRHRSLHVFFDATTCRACPQLSRCPVRQPNNHRSLDYRLDLAEELVARDHRWAEQQTDEWRADYRIRAGAEATMSELKRGHGMRRVRVRGLVRVRLQVAFKATACNLKRWGRAVADRKRAAYRLLALISASLALVIATATARKNTGGTAANLLATS